MIVPQAIQRTGEIRSGVDERAIEIEQHGIDRQRSRVTSRCGHCGTVRTSPFDIGAACSPSALLGSGVPVFMMPLDSTQVALETKEREAIFAHGSSLTDQLTLLYH